MFCWWFREESACNAGDLGPTLVSGRSPGGGHGNPLQSSCQENFTDRRAWRASWDGKEWDTTGVTNTFTVNFHANLLAPLKPHIVFPIIYCNLRNQYLSTKYLKVQNASLLRWRFNWRWKGSWGKVARVWGVRWGREASGWSPVQFHGRDFGSDPPGQLCGQVTSLKCLKLWLGTRIHPSDSGYFSQISALQCPFKVSSDNLRSFWRHRGWLFPNEVEHVRALCSNDSSKRRSPPEILVHFHQKICVKMHKKMYHIVYDSQKSGNTPPKIPQ